MSSELWIIIGIVFVVVWGFIIWELITGPVYPDDYMIVEEETESRDVPPTNEKSPPKSQTYSGSHLLDLLEFDKPKYKHWKYPTTDCLCNGNNRDTVKHTKDCTWKSETVDFDSDYRKMKMEDQEWSEDNWNRKISQQTKDIQKLNRLQTELDILHNSSDISFDHGAQMECLRIQEKIEQLMGKSKIRVNNTENRES